MFCCFLCDEQRQLVSNRRVDGLCNRCAGTVSDVRVQYIFRFCFFPVCRSHTSRIICSRCGAHYKSR
ncbi:hypothetical protein KC19_4G002400 [Ceratodon purpureus]|uniref:Uncharacterized protein n=1 Tax=Ceratodon purpureus TaxID=3225 RepID=A0A8T0I4Y4_CERPU|nr:hypothetical protein KC19_4G002400 [Ceratodon purpureus]